MALCLTDGTRIVDLSRPPQGTRHRIVFGTEESTGREVAAKIELIAGALEPERRALEWLTPQDGPWPQLHAAGTLDDSGELPGAACLVVDRVAADPASSSAAWEGLGYALAQLSRIPWEGSGLTAVDHDEFLALHQRRVEDLNQALGRDLGADLPPVPPSYPTFPLVLTHGDPGPGNFLDDGAGGTLIDWEDALVAPRGLDLGRATFIALLGSGPEGYVARDHTARAEAVVRAFLADSDRSPDPSQLDWWLSVAAVQFAHRRLERAGEPGVLPWRDALAVLEDARNRPGSRRP
ncbi:MAG TPA: aminoglycoside phosphotransferase family protein [Solirubrobacterales bacterium]|nr:aminoglycoside phosphotransferase family protein [Solirubrobacterales bacterium]